MVCKEPNEKLVELLKQLGVKRIDEESVIKQEIIGKGGFGSVFKCIYDEKIVAMKELQMANGITDESLHEITNEINFIQKAQHDNLPKFFGVMISKSNILGLIFELIVGKTLKDLADDMDDKTKLSVVYQLFEILEPLHNIKLIHRDIKPANIMIESGNKVRLIDFGISKIASNTTTFTKGSTGTTAYMPPECFDVDIEQDIANDKPISISTKIDIWALGTTISEIFSGGIIPWSKKCKNVMAIELSLVRKKPFPIPEEVKNEIAIKIIKACCVIEPNDRASASDILQLLKENNVEK